MKISLSKGSSREPQNLLNRKYQEYRKNWPIFLMLVPGIVYFIIFCYVPLYGVTIAFKDYKLLDGIMKSPWAGLKYFKMAFASNDFWNSFSNTMIISLLKLAFSFPAPILLALLLNEVKNMAFKKVVQTISYMPHFLSWVVLSGVIISFLSPSTGPVNLLLRALGHDPIFFVADNNWFRPVLVISSIWKEIGWSTIVYLAALNSVDMELYEAARIDGAGVWRIFIYVILPTSKPALATIALFHGVSQWNDFMTAKLYITEKALYPLQMKLYEIIVQQQMATMTNPTSVTVTTTAKGIQLATIIVTTLPIIIIYPLLQKHFVTGMMLGAVKE